MENDVFGISDKVAVVTGSTQGIGEATVRCFARHGAKVVVAGRQEDKGQAVAGDIGDAATYVRCDVSKEDEAHALMDAAVERFGRLDILVNNAGAGGSRVPIDEFPPEDWRYKIDVDLHGTFYCSQGALKHMLRQSSGNIINIASIAGVVALRMQIAHDSAKAAIIKMSEAMALEVSPRGVRVNTISPGSTLTEGVRKLFYGDDAVNVERREQMLSFIPLGRPGEPEEIANAALFLASDLSTYVNGHNLIVDGGWTCGYNRNF